MATIKTWVEKSRTKYRARYRNASGKARDIWPISLFDKRKDAKDAAAFWLRNQTKQATGDTNLDTPVHALFERWLVDARSGTANKRGKPIRESTIQTWRNSLAYVLENVKVIGEINSDWVVDYKSKLYEKYDGWTPHRRLVDLKSFCSYLERKKEISWDPFEHTVIARPSSRPRFYSDEEIDSLESAAIAMDDLWALLYVRLGYMCGLRFGEVVGLEISDIRRDRDSEGWGTITLWEDRTKTESSRVIPAPPKIMELFFQLCAKRTSGKVFDGWEENQFLYLWAKLVARAGMRPAEWYARRYKWADVTGSQDREEAPFHGLRHTYCRRFVENGGDMTELKEFTGHKSVDILMKTYSHFANKHLRLRAKEVYERMEARPKFVGQLWGKITPNVETMGNETNQVATQNEQREKAQSV